MLTLVCALPAGVPAAIAQEEETSLDEGLVGGIISNVLDGSDDEENGGADDAEVNQDSTDTAATVSSNQEDQTVDHDSVTFGDNTADLDDTNVDVDVPINVEEGQSTPPPDDRLRPEEVAFCFKPDLPRGFFCFDTLEECETAEEQVGSVEELLGSVTSGCERFETPPPGALSCSVHEEGQNIRCELRSL
jgi:hypothetical protein